MSWKRAQQIRVGETISWKGSDERAKVVNIFDNHTIFMVIVDGHSLAIYFRDIKTVTA